MRPVVNEQTQDARAVIDNKPNEGLTDLKSTNPCFQNIQVALRNEYIKDTAVTIQNFTVEYIQSGGAFIHNKSAENRGEPYWGADNQCTQDSPMNHGSSQPEFTMRYLVIIRSFINMSTCAVNLLQILHHDEGSQLARGYAVCLTSLSCRLT